jgi:2-polyprenyl-3-methyl-5-hydroxy-6-metoxy-1,4-benzoquinol methylase
VTTLVTRFDAYPRLAKLTACLVAAWPDHERFLEKSLSVHGEDELAELDRLAADILSLSDTDEIDLCCGYRWMCERFVEEEIFFRREDRYRCGTIAEAARTVYDNSEVMAHYMRGLLLSQIFWANHARSYLFFLAEFLPRVVAGKSYLEIGPGHGLYLARVLQATRNVEATALDTSRESLRQTRNCLARLGVTTPVHELELNVQDRAPDHSFDAICISEVLEHLEHPKRVMAHLRQTVKPGGHVYVNVPINSPAPDHIYLWRHPHEVVALVEDANFRIVARADLPMTGYTLEKALKRKITVNVALIAEPV